MNQSKGGEDLIEALSRLVQAGRDVRLVMIGAKVGSSDPTNQAYLARVEQLIQAAGLGERVVWTGYLPDSEVTATWKATDVCVLPYRDGASKRRGTLMAALAHGVPIVTTTPQLPVAHFRDGENMLLVPPSNPQALSSAVARIADDLALQQRLAAGALGLSRQFTWPAIAAATLDFYTDVRRKRGMIP